MRKLRNRLDEMQEQKLLQIESKGCWIAFWGLVIVYFGKRVFGGVNGFSLIGFAGGEEIVLLVLSLYLVSACMVNGIWDRRLKPEGRTNFWVSLAAAIIFGLMWAARVYVNYDRDILSAMITFILGSLCLFILVFGALTIAVKLHGKRVDTLENAVNEDE